MGDYFHCVWGNMPGVGDIFQVEQTAWTELKLTHIDTKPDFHYFHFFHLYRFSQFS